MEPAGARLVIHLEATVIQVVPLTADVITLGREPDNSVALAHPLVPRHHAEVRFSEEGVVLTDLGSSNGTYLGETRILPHQPQLLTAGATFEIRPFTIQYDAPLELRHDDILEPLVLEEVSQEAVTPQIPPAEAGPRLPVPIIPEEIVAPPALPVEPPVALVPAMPPRVSHPALLPPTHQSSYVHDLPVIFHDSDFLGRYLLLFESIWEPLEQRQDDIAVYFDPRSCPAAFLPWLCRWFGLPFDAHWPEGRVRDVLANAVNLYSWRGTRYGLEEIIKVCTGITVQVTQLPEEPFVIHVAVPRLARHDPNREIVEYLVQTHKPAHVGYTMNFAGDPIRS